MPTSRIIGGLMVLACLAVTTGCGGSRSDPQLVLSLATPDKQGDATGDQIQRFVDEVTRISNGTIEIQPVWDVTKEGAHDWDQTVARSVADNTYDLGLVPGRAFDALGVTSLVALNTPFLVDSDALVAEVLNSDMRTELLSGLSEADLVGIDLFPDSLRHPFGFSGPLGGPDDYQGEVIRTPTSVTVAETFNAFGARVVDDDPPDPERQIGVESSYGLAGAGVATGNVTFFPKTNALVAASSLGEGLREDQWQVLQGAAAATRNWLLGAAPTDLEAGLGFCARGGTIIAASTTEIMALKSAAAEVEDQLRRDPLTRRLIDEITALKSQIAPPEPMTQCPGSVPASLIGLDGRYVAEVPAGALRGSGVGDEADIQENAGRYKWVLDAGRWTYRQTSDSFVQNPVGSGSYDLDGDTFTFHWSEEPDDFTTMRVTVGRSGTLRFSDVNDAMPQYQKLMEGFWSVPWRRVGDLSR